MIQIENAQIKSADIEIEDHGVLVYRIEVTWNSGAFFCGLPNYALDDHHEHAAIRPGSPFGPAILRKILEVSGAESLSKMKGRYVRIKVDGLDVVDIGHIVEDRWVDFKGTIAELKWVCND